MELVALRQAQAGSSIWATCAQHCLPGCGRVSSGIGFSCAWKIFDPDRSHASVAHQQLADLAAIGIDWDADPVRQSDRHDLYEQALRTLADADLTYPCFCSRAEIREAASAPHGPLPEGSYPGTCAHIDRSEAQRRVDAGEAHCLRVRADAVQIGFDDRLLGRVEAVVDDFVVRRKDGVAAYNLAVVVDDAAQSVSEVVRGADLAEGTPRQLWLQRALGLPTPTYAHVPLVLGPDGTRLAKRHGAVTLANVQATFGWSIGDVVRWMARSLGMAASDTPTTADEVLRVFDPTAISQVDTVFDPAQAAVAEADRH